MRAPLPKRPTIFLDVDQVLVDWVKAAAGVAYRNLGAPKDAHEIWRAPANIGKKMEEMFQIERNSLFPEIQKEIGFWTGLEKLPWFDRLIDYVKNSDCDWYFLTSVTQDPESPAGKMSWLQLTFGRWTRNFIFTAHKHLMAREFTVLVDDFAKNTNAFAAQGGHVVKVPSYGDKLFNMGTGTEIGDYILGELDNVVKVMKLELETRRQQENFMRTAVSSDQQKLPLVEPC